MLAGRYRIEDVLGRGGMSTVYRATDVRLGQQVALKQLDLSHVSPSDRPAMTRVLLQEARLLARLEHPGLVRVRDCFEQAGLAYLVTDFIQGRDLQTVLDTAPGQLSGELITDWALQIVDALEYLHGQRVLYRDLKPANLMLEKSTGRLKLIDFGIARTHLPGRGTTELLRGFGSSGYAPIEQYGAGTDARSDLYSLGATLYALITRSTPPDAVRLASGEERLRQLSDPRWQKLIFKLMQTRKEDRFQTAAQVRQELLAPDAPLPGPISFCPFRDLAPAPAPVAQAPSPAVFLQGYLTVDVVYRGDSPIEAQRVASRLSAPGQAARADYYETFPGVVKGYWRVLLAQRQRQDSRP
ncbi:MAG: hypothetical protein AMXMBFR33_55530 [Candidatus Xenobia bacterium]